MLFLIVNMQSLLVYVFVLVNLCFTHANSLDLRNNGKQRSQLWPYEYGATCPPGYKMNRNQICDDINECTTDSATCNTRHDSRGMSEYCVNTWGGYKCVNISCPDGYRYIDTDQKHTCVKALACKDKDWECFEKPSSIIFKYITINGNRKIIDKVHLFNITTIEQQNISYWINMNVTNVEAPPSVNNLADIDYFSRITDNNKNEFYLVKTIEGPQDITLQVTLETYKDMAFHQSSEWRYQIFVSEENVCAHNMHMEPGTNRCACPPGYRQMFDNNKPCVDIDECETGEAPCARSESSNTTHDVCVNTRGSFKCEQITCPLGYRFEHESTNRCRRKRKVCLLEDKACVEQPTTILHDFMTFVSNLFIPEHKVLLFSIHGSHWAQSQTIFELKMLRVNAPPSVEKKADINDFLVTSYNTAALIFLVRSLKGPQSIEMDMTMKVYTREQLAGTAVAKLFLYISEYEF